jgi:beta-glucanase (GH16 family)
MDAYLYIDYDMDGQFSTGISPSTHTPVAGGELVSYSNVDGFNSLGVANANHNWALPQFTLPADLPRGVYRARLKIDYDCIDPAGRYGSAYTDKLIQDNGGCIIDFFVNVTDGERPVKLHMTDVNIYKGGNNPMPVSILPGSVALIPFITPVKQGYVVDKVIVRHGYNFDGPRVIHGNPQWTADSLLDLSTDGIYRYRLAINKVDGDVEITASAHNVYSPYRKILEEEFATTGEPSSKTWKRCTRYSSTWNRFLSNSKDVCYQADGELVLKAIPNPDKTTDKVDMLTGGIESSGKFTFQHGYLECRAKANPFAGNFPAIWMMPADGSAGWPACGEIDIMEQIDAADKAYHTVHSNWTWTLGHKTDPQSSFNETVDMSYYHTYGLEKQADTIRWYVDGVQVGQYCHVPADDASKQWPYDKAFYIILNQSVGDGSWAAKPDVTHSYQFNIDWLRVYEYRITDDIRSVNSTNKALGIETQRNTLILHAAEPCNVNVNDLAGRHIASLSVSDTSSLRLPAGIYLVNNRKVLVP